MSLIERRQLIRQQSHRADDEQADSPGNEARLDASPDPFNFALSVRLRDCPGTRYVYNSLTAYIAGLALEGAVGERVDTFAARTLFAPLAIKDWRWRRDRAGHTTGQGNLSLTAQDFAKIGQLVLDKGLWNGRRVVSARWIEESLTPRVRISAVDRYADDYGYFWYSKTYRIGARNVRVDFASGNGGNKIYVVPDRSLIVAIQSSAYGRVRGQRRSEQILLRILGALDAKAPRTKRFPIWANAAP